MSEGLPVFGSKAEAEIWDDIRKAEGQKNSQVREKSLSAILSKLETTGDTYSSAILVKMIEIVSAEEAEGWKDDVRDLVGKQRAQDCRASLAAASCLAEKGIVNGAHSFLDCVQQPSDIPTYAYVKAEVLSADQQDKEAVRWLMNSLRSDPLNVKAYDFLARLMPRKNWKALLAIESMAAGKEYEEPEHTGGPDMALFSIYREWYKGDRDSANRMLISSEGYKNGDSDYVLLSARMARDEGDWANAQRMYEKASKSMPDDVSILVETGNAYLKGGDAESALARYRSAEAHDPANPMVVRGLINGYIALGKNSEALEVIKEFLGSEMAAFDDYKFAAREMLRMGFSSEAASTAQSIIYTYPGDATACIVMSRAMVTEGNLREAESYAKQAVSYNKKNPNCLAQMSRVYLVLRRTAKAGHYAKRAVAADETSVPALTTLMEVYRETGDNDRAMETCRRILGIDPHNEEAANVLSKLEMAQVIKDSNASAMLPAVSGSDDFVRLVSTLIAENKFSEAEKLCMDNDEKYGGVAAVRRLRGNAEYALGEFLKASASFASAAALEPADPEIWHSKGLADEAFGDLDSAEAAYNQAVLLDMRNPHYWISKGCVQEQKGNKIAAVDSFNRAIELDQSSTFALVKKATILAEYGRFSDALNFMDLAEATDPKNGGILKIKMQIYLAATRYTDAAYIGKKLIKKNPDPEVIACLARAEIGLDDTASARKLLDKALAADQDDIQLLAVYRELCIKQGDNESLIDICRRIIRIDQYDKESKKALADALYKVGRGDEASMLYASLERGPDEEPQRLPEARKAAQDDPASVFQIAKSLLEAGDIVGAGRMADKALEADPGNTDFILFRTLVYKRTGDIRVADTFLAEYVERDPSNAQLLEAAGDLKTEEEDYPAASEAYVKAVKNGGRRGVYVKLGFVQEKMNANEAAVNSYSNAVRLDPHDADAARALALVQIKIRDYDGALRSVRASLATEPTPDAYAILAVICQMKKDRDGVKEAYRGLVGFANPPEELVDKVIVALNSVGLRSEALSLRSHADGEKMQEPVPEEEVPAPVKRLAERIMRRAYMLGADVSDPAILDALNADPDTAEAAVRFLAGTRSFGDVIPGMSDFDRYEHLSYNAVFRGKNKDLEAMTVECAYVAGGARDVDEAKTLLAYIRAAMASKIPREIPPEVRRMAGNSSDTDTLEQIMLDNKCGVMTARMVLSVLQEKGHGA